jgi:hypothetical protein
MGVKQVIQQLRGIAARKTTPRGQSLVELTFVFPILLLMLAGLIEVGYYINNYLTVLDASREAARHAADLNPRSPYTDNFMMSNYDGNPVSEQNACGGAPGEVNGPDSPGCLDLGCDVTGYFYHKAACLVETNMHPLSLDLSNPNVDVVITVVAVIKETEDLLITERLPAINSNCTPDGETPYFNGSCTTLGCCENDCYWSYSNYVYEGTAEAGTGQASGFSCTEITDILNESSLRNDRPNGFVIVEVFYEHHQLLNLPIISQVIPDPIVVRAYSMMPVSAAEPTPTPIP